MNKSLNTLAPLGALLGAPSAHAATAHVGFENRSGVDPRVEIPYSTADATSYGKPDVQKTRNIGTLKRRELGDCTLAQASGLRLVRTGTRGVLAGEARPRFKSTISFVFS